MENIKQQLEEVIKKEESNSIKRSNLWNEIYNVVKQIPRKETNDDAMDYSSCSTEIEKIVNNHTSLIADEVLKVVVEKIEEEKQKYIKKNEREYGVYKDEIDTCRNIIIEILLARLK